MDKILNANKKTSPLEQNDEFILSNSRQEDVKINDLRKNINNLINIAGKYDISLPNIVTKFKDLRKGKQVL